MTETLLPGLLIAVPILGATLPLALGLVRERVGWSVAAVVLAIETAIAAWVAYAVYVDGARIVHFLGGGTFGRRGAEGFAVGIELVADALSAIVILLVAAVSLAVLAFSRRSGPRGNAFYSGYLLLTGGLMGVALTGDLFNMFVFLEITGLATYALVASDRSAESAVAALKYLVIGTAGASLYLVGVGYIFVRTGTLNMVDVSNSLAGEPEWIEAPLYGEPLVLAAFGFIAVGLLVKAAIYPLHTWQPDAYASAPDSVTIYISALVSTVSAYAFGRIVLNVFTPEFFAVTPIAIEAVLVLAGLSVVAGSALAAAQRRIQRMFAYSSVAQFGLIVIAFGIAVHPAGGATATRFAIYGAMIHLFAHAIIKGGLFATAGAIAAGEGARTVTSYAGVAKQRPFLAGSIAVLGFGIIGVPPTVGFIGKWYMAVGAVESGLWAIVLVVFLSTLLTLLYVARLLEKLYFDYPTEDAPRHSEPSGSIASEWADALGGSDREMATDGGRGTDTDDVVADDGGEYSLTVREGATGPDDAPAPPSVTDVLPDRRDSLSWGMFGLAVGTAVLAFVLGFAGSELTAAVDPIVEAVLASEPEVVGDG